MSLLNRKGLVKCIIVSVNISKRILSIKQIGQQATKGSLLPSQIQADSKQHSSCCYKNTFEPPVSLVCLMWRYRCLTWDVQIKMNPKITEQHMHQLIAVASHIPWYCQYWWEPIYQPHQDVASQCLQKNIFWTLLFYSTLFISCQSARENLFYLQTEFTL